MKRLMFYCQHILGMGHLVRSMEIVRGLTPTFQVCFINGGEIINGFAIPDGIEIVNLPAIKTDSEFRTLQAVDSNQDLAILQEVRKTQLLAVFKQFQPDVLMVELFPFGRRKFSFELIPLLEEIRAQGKQTKVVCSLRDIVVTKQNRDQHEEKVCTLMNQYFDLLLIHGDAQFQPIEETFSRIHELRCPVHYTGYVVQSQRVQSQPESAICDTSQETVLTLPQPLILATVGGGRFGHELLNAVVDTAPILEVALPHHIQVFTGPFFPDKQFADLQAKAVQCGNLTVDRFTPNLLPYMQKADLSISMSGYNTTMNVLTTGTRALLLAFTGNDDQEQRIRSEKLAKLGVVDTIQPDQLEPHRFALHVMTCLQKQPTTLEFDFNGVTKTAALLQHLVADQQVA
ncbi:glycosyltransferase family protein [Myxacorys almedinensis]|uniref:Glycosyl transferase n=1 Tax=Myxacorys almedinensis A TaxID=2690445 RepID=A0A8J8CHA8_9CYAN|nr:glycosyltransferase [Myxacorys almedinensis]NDJ16444.1 glycosyl transferase [Myxacorys almedinensis A]